MKPFALAAASLLGLGLLLSSAPASAQFDPPFVARGPQVGTFAAENSLTCVDSARAGMWPDGRTVMTWVSGFAYGDFRTYDPEGAPLLEGFVGTSRSVDVATAAYGGFVSVFEHGSPEFVNDLSARIYDPQQVVQQPEAFIFAPFSARLPVVAVGDDGQFVVAWADSVPSPAIWAARFDRAGNAVGGNIAVGTVSGSAQRVDVTRGPDGGFTVYWLQSASSGGSLLHLRRFGPDGSPLGDEVPVPAADPQFPEAAGAPNGDAVLVYVSALDHVLWARLLAADGTLGEAFPVFAHASHPAIRGEAAFLGDGTLAVAAEIEFDGGPASVHLFHFDRDGHQLGPRVGVVIPATSVRRFKQPRIAAAGDRVTVFYGRERTDDGSACYLFLRTFDQTLFADSFESGDLSAWNGI